MSLTPDMLFEWLRMLTATPHLMGLILALSTFITEDGALITGSLLVGGGMMDAPVAILWIAGGIVVGDVGLYGAGAWLRESRFVRRTLSPRRMRRLKRWLKGRESLVLFFSRFLPGTRLPTYLGFGYLRLSLLRFTLVLLVAGTVWVSMMVLFVSETQKFLSQYGGMAGLAGGVAIALLFIIIAPMIARRISKAPDLSESQTASRATDAQNHANDDQLK